FRSLIKHYFLRGKTAKETKEKLDKYYVANTPSDYTVKYWFREFRGGRNSTTDEVRRGRPSDAVTEENVKKIHEMVLADRKMKVRELADATKISISHGTVISILHEQLGMKKLSARWVLRLLTVDHKRSMAKFNEFRYELLPHPAYSPDLAPCDYFLFPNLKKWFGGKRFTTREQLIAETEAYFEGLDKSYYSDEKVGESLDQVYRAERDYVEIKMNRSKKMCFMFF
ncbi:FLJ37770-like protein, partial [Acromyrmex echinatior]